MDQSPVGRLQRADSRGAAVVLVGGQMTVDDGSTLDSRQPILGDPGSVVTRKSLATSLLWWTTVASLVNPILQDAGTGAFALVIGGRTVAEVRPDGELRRTRLATFLRGGSTSADIVRCIDEPLPDGYQLVAKESVDQWVDPTGYRQVNTLFGYRFNHVGERWVFLDGNDYYLPKVIAHIHPSVIVDTSGAFARGSTHPSTTEEGAPLPDYYAGHLMEFDKRRFLDEQIVVVMPHTHGAESFISSYLHWVEKRRPNDDPSTWTPIEPNLWDPAAPPDPIRYTCPVPVRASFKVTGLMQGGRWNDPSHLEAARSLLLARYDLKIGIWDLANNPTLRHTLLKPGSSIEASIELAEVPRAASERARRQVAKKMAQRATEADGRRQIDPQLEPLRGVGWSTLTPGTDLFLPMSELIPLSVIRRSQSYPDEEMWPLVRLELAISKRHTVIKVFTIMYNQVDLKAYVRSRRQALEEIASPEACTLSGTGRFSVWETSCGWGDDADWTAVATEIAKRSPRWERAFDDLCKECRGLLARWATIDESHSHTALPPSSTMVEGPLTPESLGQPMPPQMTVPGDVPS